MAYQEVTPEGLEKRGRKSVEALVESIFNTVPDDDVISIDRLSNSINSTWRTTEKWLTLIWRIQRAPRIRALRQRGGKLFVWQKDRGTLPENPRRARRDWGKLPK